MHERLRLRAAITRTEPAAHGALAKRPVRARAAVLAGFAALALLALGGQTCAAGVLYESDFSGFAGAGVAPEASR